MDSVRFFWILHSGATSHFAKLNQDSNASVFVLQTKHLT